MPVGQGDVLQPRTPYALHIAGNDPGGVGINAIHDQLDRGAVRTPQSLRIILAQDDDGIHMACPHRRFRLPGSCER
ncbi:hypothetical protein GALL_396740 [mine drainage metagenome]|uniref:Uncharacterized protein n=1 Tax=mine drainage metagenome TaxID=410659 RepID=A0A1J5Q4L1_9ZZZZ